MKGEWLLPNTCPSMNVYERLFPSGSVRSTNVDSIAAAGVSPPCWPLGRVAGAAAGARRFRDEREDPGRGPGSLEDHVDRAFPDRRLRSAPHRVAEPSRRGELGGQDDDRLGDAERASRAVHLARRRLAAGPRRGVHHVAGSCEPQVRGGAVVPVDQGNGEGRSREPRAAGNADRARARRLSRAVRPQGQRRHRDGRTAAGRSRELQRTPEAHARRAGARAIRAAGSDPAGARRPRRRPVRRRSRWPRRADAAARRTSLGAAGQSARHAVFARQSAGAATHAAGRRTHSRRHRRTEWRGPDLRRHDAAAAGRHPSHRRLRPHLPHHRRRHAGDRRVQHLESIFPAGEDVLRHRRRDSGNGQGGRSR